MKLYLISQSVNNDYDTFDEAVVCAESEEEARKIHPDGGYDYEEDGVARDRDTLYGTWAKKKDVKVTEIGEANEKQKKGVVCASFHAG